MSKLWLQQEILLLALSDSKGTFTGGMYMYSIAGAMVSELLLMQRLVAEGEKKLTRVLDSTSTGDEILDELLAMIYESSKQKDLKHWVTKAANIPKLKHRVAQQLCEKGILKHDETKILWMFTQNTYPELNGAVEDAIRESMAQVMFDEKAKPDGQTAVLIALASHGGLLKANFAPEELKQHKQRIKDLAKGDILAADATKAVIDAIQAAVMVAVMIPAITAATASH